MKILLYNGLVVSSTGMGYGAILVSGEKIGKVIFDPEPATIEKLSAEADVSVDCGKRYIFPGFVDPHVHLRDMEQRYKETIKTGTAAAIHGGFTVVGAMPNTVPPISTPDVFNRYRKIIEKNTYCDVAVYATIGHGFSPDSIKYFAENGAAGIKVYPGATSEIFHLDWNWMLELREKLTDKGFREDGTPVHLERFVHEMLHLLSEAFKNGLPENWVVLFEECARYGLPLLFHPDLPIDHEKRMNLFGNLIKSGYSELEAHSIVYGKVDELTAIGCIAGLAYYLKEEGKKVPKIRFCHVSCPESVNTVRIFSERFERDPFEIEVTPHHLLLNITVIEKNPDIRSSVGKVLQPLRTINDNKKLLRMLRLNKIDIIGSDHAPHSIDEKNRNFTSAPNGFPGLETSVIYMLTATLNGLMSPKKFVRYSCLNPARAMGLKSRGDIREGFFADLVILEHRPPYIPHIEGFFTKAKYTPFIVRKSEVKIIGVFLRGRPVYNTGTLIDMNKIAGVYGIIEPPSGRFIAARFRE